MSRFNAFPNGSLGGGVHVKQNPALHSTRATLPIAKLVASGMSLATIHNHNVSIAMSNKSSVSM
ncbi:hypothetical protein N7520_000868 [Penicillium odoratum]|uniref:uncharacterized protein n=1 Tax=Penicillium odoratum TaxID=1167516 RepID=UPI0025471BCA|nr:uncharacterized protein N7520_000868 [Penicillium odoratum]KAJ5777622.1 hypothetical protein N7520_000868 [Penicillium odoratum]